MIDAGGGYTPTPVVSHAILGYNRGRRARARRRHRRHAVAQSAAVRRLQVQPAARRSGRHGRHAVDRGPRQRAASPTACAAWRACRSRAPAPRRRRTGTTTSTRTSRDLAVGRRSRRDPRQQGAHRRRPARRREPRVLGRDRRALRPRPRGREPHRSIRPSAS